MPVVDDPLEAAFVAICEERGWNFTRPEREAGGHGPNGTLDFYLPQFGLAVEVKAWSCKRLVRQLEGRTGVMVLIGLDAVRAFGRMLICAQYGLERQAKGCS